METDRNTNKPNNKPDESSNPVPQSESDNSLNVTADKNNPDSAQQHSPKIRKRKQGTIKRNEQYWKKWSDPLVICTILLTIATFLLYRQASKDSKIAENSAEAAKKSADAAIEATGEQKRNNQLSEIAQNKRYALDSTNLQTQINNLQEMQKEFIAENEAYLEITDIIMRDFQPNEEPLFTYKIKNLGAQVAKEYSNISQLQFIPMNEHVFFQKNPLTYMPGSRLNKVGRYFTKETPVEAYFQFGKGYKLPDTIFNGVVKKELFVIFIGEIIYRNSVTNTKRVYKFVFEIQPGNNINEPFPSQKYDMIYNDNYNIKPTSPF